MLKAMDLGRVENSFAGYLLLAKEIWIDATRWIMKHLKR